MQSDSPAPDTTLVPLTDKIAIQVRLPPGTRGVVVAMAPSGSDAAGRDIRRGDVITHVNNRFVTSLADVDRAVEEAIRQGRQTLLLKIVRGDSAALLIPVMIAQSRSTMPFVTEAKTISASTEETSDASSLAVGQTFRDCEQCPEMVVVSEGSFMMGADATEPDRQTDEGPVRTVSIQRAFAIGKYEVTQVEWNACVTDGGCPVLLNVENAQMERPVANVSWSDTRSYAAWLSSKTGNRYFLPSEAKWEYASRAGTTTP